MATASQIASAGTYITDDVGVEITDGSNVRAQLGKLGTNSFGLKVISSDGSTVIVDGTSDMFKIAAQGTISVTTSAVNTRAATAVSITALGTQSSTLAHQCFVGVSGGANHLSFSNNGVILGTAGAGGGGWVANVLNGATNLQCLVTSTAVQFYGDIDGSSHMRITLEAWTCGSGLSTYAGRYYVLTEVAV